MNINSIEEERYEAWAPYSNHQTYCKPNFHTALFSSLPYEQPFSRPAAICQEPTHLDQRA